MITIKEIQARFREAIITCPLSKKEIAKRVGINQSTISKYLYQDKYPSIDTFANLCEVLDVSSDEILGLRK